MFVQWIHISQYGVISLLKECKYMQGMTDKGQTNYNGQTAKKCCFISNKFQLLCLHPNNQHIYRSINSGCWWQFLPYLIDALPPFPLYDGPSFPIINIQTQNLLTFGQGLRIGWHTFCFVWCYLFLFESQGSFC